MAFGVRAKAKIRRLAASVVLSCVRNDNKQEIKTVNGVKAHGGSMDGPGAVVVNGMVYVNSGYPRNGGMPGNVMLAFGPE